MNGPDPAREAAILARCAVCGGGTKHGMLVQDLAGAWGHAMLLDCLASLKAQLAAARARAERAEGALAKRVGEVRAAGLLAYRKAKGEACRLDLQVRCYSCEREYNEVVDGILAALAARGK